VAARLPGPVLPRRFTDEARASLPDLVGTADPPPEEVFAALLLQRLRLRHDQQVPAWCRDQRSVRNDPNPRLGSSDAYIARASEFQHTVEDMGSQFHFSRPTLVYT
jgi:hypothetical protein